MALLQLHPNTNASILVLFSLVENWLHAQDEFLTALSRCEFSPIEVQLLGGGWQHATPEAHLAWIGQMRHALAASEGLSEFLCSRR